MKNELSLLKSKISSLYDALAHGDDNHKDWLKKAIEAHFSNSEMPKYCPSINEKRIMDLEQEVLDLKAKLNENN